MSMVTVQLGQCGNQVGGEFFHTIVNDIRGNSSLPGVTSKQYEDYVQTSTERFFHKRDDDSNTLEARSVLVDMEQKVITQTLSSARRSGSWTYPNKQQFCQKRGSGNNWAHGFCTHGPRSKEPVLNMVRREVEKCDNFGGFLMLMSLAGGTGSGLGTYLTQCLRDEYPHAFMLNQVVWPYRMGEVVVQNYNAVLTMAHLYQSADAILIMQNDDLQRICTRLLGLKNVSFSDINKVIAHNLSAVLQPCYSSLRKADWEQVNPCHLGDLLEHLAPHPAYKLLTLRNIPQMAESSIKFSKFQWHGLLKHLHQMLVAQAPMEEGIDWQIHPSTSGNNFNKSLSSLLVLRGQELMEADDAAFQDARLFTSWAPPPMSYTAWAHPKPLGNYEKSAALLSNCQTPVCPLDHLVGRAWEMFASRAYVHHYLKHGLTEENFVDCFAALEQVIHSYKHL